MGASNPLSQAGPSEILRGSPAGRRVRLPEKVGVGMRKAANDFEKLEELEMWLQLQFPRSKFPERNLSGEWKELVSYLHNQLF